MVSAVPHVPRVASLWILHRRTSTYSSSSCVFEPSVLRCEVDVVYMFDKTRKVAPKPRFDGKKPSTVHACHVSGVAVSSRGSPAPLEPPLWLLHFFFPTVSFVLLFRFL